MSENVENPGALDIPPVPEMPTSDAPLDPSMPTTGSDDASTADEPTGEEFNPIYRKPRDYDPDGFVQHEDAE